MPNFKISLALQGGGSHGAYTWGVLDRILQDERIEIEAVAGASAGAMNAAVLACGYARGGRAGAREALDRFWTAVSKKSFAAHPATAALSEPATRAYAALTRYFSPYQLNPLDVNPLRDIVTEQIDCERLRSDSRIALYISATRVRDGRLRLFTHRDLSHEALLASACLPGLFRAVEIDGEAYWDGGLAANPPLSPLAYQCDAQDLVIVTLDAPGNGKAPETADAIRERLSHLSFSATLWTELNAISTAKAEAERAWISFGRIDRRLRSLAIHVIEPADGAAGSDASARLKTDARFLRALREQGSAAAEQWLEDRLGSEPTGRMVDRIRRYAFG